MKTLIVVLLVSTSLTVTVSRPAYASTKVPASAPVSDTVSDSGPGAQSENKSPIPFPKDFWWGTSLAGHQAEGGLNDSWTRWEQTPGHIKNHEQSGKADDHWNRYDEDFENLRWLNANTHRMSIEWSRLEPQQGQWDEVAAAHYREMILDLKSKGIRPVLCLFHFALPLWVEDAGGFENPKMIDAFVEFSKKVEATYGDLVTDWFTMNEPSVYALGGYGAGITPPGVADIKRAIKVMANLMRAHARVYHALKSLNPEARVSFAHHMRVFNPKYSLSPLDQGAAHAAWNIMDWAWLDAIKNGRIQLKVPLMAHLDEPCPECLGALDYISINYYTRDLIHLKIFSKDKFATSVHNGTKSDLGWEIYPEGLGIILSKIKSRGYGNYPILIAENGIADKDDQHRPQFIYEHLKVFLETCQKLNLAPMGYLHWSRRHDPQPVSAAAHSRSGQDRPRRHPAGRVPALVAH